MLQYFKIVVVCVNTILRDYRSYWPASYAVRKNAIADLNFGI